MLTFFICIILLFKGFMYFIARETQKLYHKILGNFPVERNKKVHIVIGMYFSLFLKGLKILPNPRLSLIVPLNGVLLRKLQYVISQ